VRKSGGIVFEVFDRKIMRPRMKCKRWIFLILIILFISVSGDVDGLLRFSFRPRGGWFVWFLWAERQQQRRRQPQRQQRLGWCPEIQLFIPLDRNPYLTGGELNPTAKHFSNFLNFCFNFQILLRINATRFFCKPHKNFKHIKLYTHGLKSF